MRQAETDLEALIASVLAGEEVIVVQGDRALVRIVPWRPKRKFGAMKGQFSLTDAFFEPLPDDELALWNGEGA